MGNAMPQVCTQKIQNTPKKDPYMNLVNHNGVPGPKINCLIQSSD